jgi:Uma2 family endonuclease
MGEPAKRHATYEDLFNLPEHQVGEIIGGVLEVSPRPAKPNAHAASVLGEELGPPFRRGRGGPGGWMLLDEPELHLRKDILVPGMAGWRLERMPELVDDVPYFTLAPDWICEVLSPSTAELDRRRKMPIYAREGVSHAWLVDPLARTLEVLRREGDKWLIVTVAGCDDKGRFEPFDAIELDLSFLWQGVVLQPKR